MYWGCEIRNGSRRPAANRSAGSQLLVLDYRGLHLGLFFVLALLALGAQATPYSKTCFAQAQQITNEPYAPATIAGLIFTTPDFPEPKPRDRLVIIIDDIGNNLRRGRDALELPGRLTYAVIPHTPYDSELATLANDSGKEVMVHAPMSTLGARPLGTGGLTPDLSQEDFREAVKAALQEVPHARGVNNHMGSELTQRREQMSWLMEELRWHNMYFVDSRTSSDTVAATVASEFRVPNLSRNVFLDNEPTEEAIDRQFRTLLAKARGEGLAVAIGHPYPQTIAYLRQALPGLQEQGFELVFVSEALEEEPAGLASMSNVSGLATAPDC